MRTLGIDLASYSGTTGICAIDWERRVPVVSFPRRPGKITDADLLNQIGELNRVGEADWVAIDAPFGFPIGFTDGAAEYSTHGRWSDLKDDPKHDEWADVIRRQTDLHVQKRLSKLWEERHGRGEDPGFPKERAWPLSSVVEQITATTIRCARLLTATAESTGIEVDRVGRTTQIVEAYPIAALHLWDLVRYDGAVPGAKSYKNRAEGRPARQAILTNISERLPIKIESEDRELMAESDDATDSLVCALVARLAAHPDGSSWPEHQAPEHDPDLLEREGWIHGPGDEDLREQLSY